MLNKAYATTKSDFTVSIGAKIAVKAPDKVLSLCIDANTFPNPKFYSNEAVGRSNWQTARTLTTYQQEGELCILPRGYANDLISMLHELEIAHELIDERIATPCAYPKLLEGISLRSYQQKAVDAAMACTQGVIISPTGSGKSLIGLEIIRRQSQKALIIVHRGDLAKQWINTISKRLGLKAGFIGDGEWDIGNEITVAMVQTLASKENKARELYKTFGLVLVDEVHHAPASTCFNTINCFSAKFRYGLSATPQRSDGLEPLIYRAIGPVASVISKSEVEEIGATVPAEVFVISTKFTPGMVNSWNEYVSSLSEAIKRNEMIINLVRKVVGATLVLVDRIAHANQLSKMLKKINVDHVLAHGQMSDRENIIEKIQSSPITIGTCSLLGEGIDVSLWCNLILGTPISSEIKLLQAIGRVVRPAPEKERAIIFDLKDDCAFSKSSFNKRFLIYKKNNIYVNF